MRILIFVSLIIVKHTPNSFFETNLAVILKQEGITDIVVCGMMSHMCVDSTTRACKDYALKATQLSDACATKDLVFKGKTIPAETVRDVFMASLNGMFANVIKTGTLIV